MSTRLACRGAQLESEYCLFFAYDTWWLCLTKSEWGSWVSGLGTTLGVLVALGIALVDWKRRSRDEFNQRAVRGRRATMLAYPVMTHLWTQLETLSDRLSHVAGKGILRIEADRLLLRGADDLEQIGDSIESLDPNIADAILSTMTWAKQINLTIERCAMKTPDRVGVASSTIFMAEAIGDSRFLSLIGEAAAVCKNGVRGLHRSLFDENWDDTIGPVDSDPQVMEMLNPTVKSNE